MRYAVSSLFGFAAVSSLGRGQAYSVHRAAKEAGKAQTSGLRGTGVVCAWLDNARSCRAPQSHAAMAG